MLKLALCGIFALSIGGCAAPQPVPVTAGQIAGFQKGITTEAEVIAILGKPITTVSSMDGGKILAYSSTNSGIRGATFIPVVGLFAGGIDMKINTATFTFDRGGKLTDYHLSDTAYSANALGQRQPTRE